MQTEVTDMTFCTTCLSALSLDIPRRMVIGNRNSGGGITRPTGVLFSDSVVIASITSNRYTFTCLLLLNSLAVGSWRIKLVTGMSRKQFPKYSELPIRSGLPQGSAWGVFDDGGVKDVLGTLNFITNETILEAKEEIKIGQSINLKYVEPYDCPQP